jgi:hypothetical protein
MTEAEAVDVVYEGLLGLHSLPVKLRERQGLDRAQLAGVEAALDLLQQRYADSEVVPKRLAAAFVDIQGGMEQSRAWYPDADQDEIQDAADRLTMKAYALLGE